MPTFSQAVAFAAVATVIIVIPGPSVLFVVGRALAHGRRTALVSVLGNALGAFAVVAAVAFGVGAVVARSVTVFTVLKLFGAAYLVYLGVQAFRHRRSLQDAVGGPVEVPRGRALWQGIVVGATNPKTLVFFVAVLPQFVDRDRGHVPLQMLLFGLIFCAIALLCDSVWGLTAGAARTWLARSPRRLAAIGGTGGLMMIGLGVTVAATGRRD
ncbi:LysE family translocator [Actinomadura kijaniata]|uniref:Threonine/homoserine/homoserine lactone efflux protein n=1 Tax=Actinomadura namibiensis TaxID=182080 RepID=A0A7W3LMT1_ACTNM|nr:LysE family translocator [Actinomadura namibiensis]MBA8951003.1 threonine/homoserine/homoserine lactone efflux protein [Actinomadura namibiensis]